MKRTKVKLALAAAAAMSVSACGASASGSKTDLAEVCQQRMKASSEACGCYADTIEASLPAETFSKVTAGVKMNREYRSAEILPANVIADPMVRQAMAQASSTCLRSV